MRRFFAKKGSSAYSIVRAAPRRGARLPSGAANAQYPRPAAFSAPRGLLQRLHDVVDAEARRLLPRREIFEGRDELAHDGLSRHHQERMADAPLVIGVRRDVGPLVGIHSQVVQLRQPQAGERLRPDPQRAFNALLAEHLLPILVADRHELAVVVEVEEFLARGLVLLAGQVGKLIVAVEMHLVGAPAGLPALQQALLHAGIAGRREQGREPVEAREYLVRHAARADAARPAHECRHAERPFPVRVAERRIAAVRPRVHVRPVVGGVESQGGILVANRSPEWNTARRWFGLPPLGGLRAPPAASASGYAERRLRPTLKM